MAKKSKRYTEAAALIENGKLYSAEEAIELVKKTSNKNSMQVSMLLSI